MLTTTKDPRDTIFLPPGPAPKPFIGNMPTFTTDRLNSFLQLRENYGDIVYMRIRERRLYMLNHPDYVKHVLQDNNRNYHKSQGYDKMAYFLGKGLLTSEDDLWRRQRRLAQPAFHRRRIADFGETMTSRTVAMLEEEWHGRGQVDILPAMMRLTLDIITRTMFTAALTDEEMATVNHVLPEMLEEANRRMMSLTSLREKLPLPSGKRYQQQGEALNKIIYRIIQTRRDAPSEAQDLLQMLMDARDEETGEGMTDQQLRDEAMTIFLAGHETTANNLTWTLYLLSLYPAVREKLLAELDGVLHGRVPTTADLPHLPYLHMVIHESLRLYPPAWSIGRMALDWDEIGGYPIPPRAVMILSPYTMHRDPRYWENPEAFQPERFASGWEKNIPRYAYFPFGGGPRLCIGNNFALMESALILATILQRYQCDLLPGHPVEPEPNVTLRAQNGLPMRLRLR